MLPAIEPTQPANKDLTWEKSTQTDIGLDFGFFNNRISGEIDYYNKKNQRVVILSEYPVYFRICQHIQEYRKYE